MIMNIATPATLAAAAEHLAAHDPYLKVVIERSGTCTLEPHDNYYRALVEEIIGQQLSIKAAAAIRRKFIELFDGAFPGPLAILDKAPEELRGAGLSWAKVKYIQDLARHVLDGKVKFGHFDNLSNDEIIAELTDVKGIGEWTAHMFLMFCMGRLDVLPVGDLGIRNGVRGLYSLKHQPQPADITKLARKYRWHPYESVASWYVWESLDNKPL
jgi:DNA-3-methyladenine glycosylase II